MTWPDACVLSTSIFCGTFFLYVLILARKRSENARFTAAPASLEGS